MNKWRHIHRKIFHRKGYGIHSPFVFDLITNVVEQRLPFYAYKDIDLIRLHLRLHNQSIIYKEKQYSIKKYLQKQAITKKEGELLFRLSNHYKLHSIVSVGSSMGFTPLYLTGYSSKSQCITLEQEQDIAAIAQKSISKSSCSLIQIMQGAYQSLLPEALSKLQQIDCIYISKEITTEELMKIYQDILPFLHDKSIVIISGIHASSQKRNLWKQICKDPKITVSVDLYKLGLIFFRPKLHKRMYKSRML